MRWTWTLSLQFCHAVWYCVTRPIRVAETRQDHGGPLPLYHDVLTSKLLLKALLCVKISAHDHAVFLVGVTRDVVFDGEAREEIGEMSC